MGITGSAQRAARQPKNRRPPRITRGGDPESDYQRPVLDEAGSRGLSRERTVRVVLFGLVEYRELKGPLAWAALEYLAVAAHHDDGWAAPLRVRDIATGIGVTKDTVACAVTSLRGAGLVTLEQLDPIDGRRRTGYRLPLPQGIQLRARPEDQDSPPQQARTDRCPDDADTGGCPNDPDSGLAASGPLVEPAGQRPGYSPPRRRRRATSPMPAARPALFYPPAPDALLSLHSSDPRSTLTVHAPTAPRERHGHP
jgi:hypothetical protein